MKDREWAVTLARPHHWTSGPEVYMFETEDEAQKFAHENAEGQWGKRDFCEAKVWSLVAARTGSGSKEES